MKAIKNIVMAAIFVFGGAALAQDNNPEPQFERKGDLIIGTFYYEDGNVKQEGTYKNGKLHGKWISYDKEGRAEAIAQYTDGKKTGKWFFWSGDKLSEVDYEKNRISGIKSWKSGNSLSRL